MPIAANTSCIPAHVAVGNTLFVSRRANAERRAQSMDAASRSSVMSTTLSSIDLLKPRCTSWHTTAATSAKGRCNARTRHNRQGLPCRRHWADLRLLYEGDQGRNAPCKALAARTWLDIDAVEDLPCARACTQQACGTPAESGTLCGKRLPCRRKGIPGKVEPLLDPKADVLSAPKPTSGPNHPKETCHTPQTRTESTAAFSI